MPADRLPDSTGFWRERYRTLTLPLADGGEGLSAEVADVLVGFEQLQHAVHVHDSMRPDVGVRRMSLAGKMEAVWGVGCAASVQMMARGQMLWTLGWRAEGVSIGDAPRNVKRMLAVPEGGGYKPLSLVQAEVAIGTRDMVGVLDIARVWRRMTASPRTAGAVARFEGKLAKDMFFELLAAGEEGVVEQSMALALATGAGAWIQGEVFK